MIIYIRLCPLCFETEIIYKTHSHLLHEKITTKYYEISKTVEYEKPTGYSIITYDIKSNVDNVEISYIGENDVFKYPINGHLNISFRVFMVIKIKNIQYIVNQM